MPRCRVMDVRVEMLTEDSPLLDSLVAWHWREWGNGSSADRDDWRARIRSRSNTDRIPFTLVAYLDGEPTGSVSICNDNADERFAYRGAWLTGMYVLGPARNLGVGRELVRVAEQTARRFGATELRLHTAEAGPFYERCGWSYLHRKDEPNDQSVMRQCL